MLTMFSLVLAIGMLVDDAIVVVENVERVMHEENLDARSATRKSMRQITGALVGIALVLSAVFVPMAFFPGTTGAIYRQFSLTIVSAMSLSVLVALVFTPSLCATLLKPKPHGPPRRGLLGGFSRGVAGHHHGATSAPSATWPAHAPRFLLVYVLIVGALGLLFVRLPGGFLPDEDQGTLYANVLLPPGATTERTAQVMDQVGRYFYETEKDIVFGAMNVFGFSFGGRGQNVGLVFVNLKDWERAPRP